MLLRILKLLLKLRGSFKKFHKQFYNEMEGKIGLLLIFMVLIEVQEYYTTDLELNVFIKSDTVSSCVPETCSINCGDKAIIQLKTYKYVLERTTEKLLSNTTALLYEACSGKQLCNVTKIDGFQNSPINQQDGYYRIRYVCPGLRNIYDICSASIDSTGISTYIALNKSKDYSDIMTCTCRVYGKFKQLKLIDVRLNDDDQKCSRSSLTVQPTDGAQPTLKEMNCTDSPEFNTVITMSDHKAVNVSISNFSNSLLPAMVWMKVIKRTAKCVRDEKYSGTSPPTSPNGSNILDAAGKKYNIECSSIINAETTTEARSTTDLTSISTHQTLSPPTRWPKTESAVHISKETSPKLSKVSTTLQMQSTNTTEYTSAYEAKTADLEGSSFPVIAAIIPVVAAVVAGVSMLVIIVYRRKRKRGKPQCEHTAITNAAYTDTSYEEHASPIDGIIRLHSSEKISQGTTDNQAPDLIYDDQYTIITSNGDNEYNKINFSTSPIPFDSNYGHIHSTNTADKNYAHLAGVAGSDSDPYTYTSTEGIINDKNACNNGDFTSAKDAKLEANEDDPNYDHMGSKGNKDARNKLGRTDDNNFDTDLPKGITNTGILDNANTATHPYFILQPTDNLEVRIQNDINDKIDIANAYNNGGQNIASKDIPLDSVSELHDTAHQYFTLQPNTDKEIDVSTNFKVDDKGATSNVYSNCESNSHRPTSETYFDLERNNLDSMHQYSALETTGSSPISIGNGVYTDTTHDYFVLETDSQNGK